jgi:quercetin dioxygenase-like cupin family protein
MAETGQMITNPVTGERLRWHLTEADTGGRLVRAEIFVRPGGGVFVEHLHPESEERFEVLRGRMILERDGEPSVLVRGERARIPAGVPHRWRNGSAEELHVIVDVVDPCGFEHMIEDAFAAARAGRTDGKGRVKLLPGAAFLRSHARSTRPTSPPLRLQRLLVPPLALLGRVLGRRRLVALAAVLSIVAAAPVADAATYKGKTEGGGRISFNVSGKKISRVNGAVPMVCLETMGSYQSSAGAELYQPPGAFRLGRTAQVKAFQPAAMNQGIDATKTYTFHARRSGRRVTGKLRLSFSFLRPGPSIYQSYIYMCSSSVSFSAKETS